MLFAHRRGRRRRLRSSDKTKSAKWRSQETERLLRDPIMWDMLKHEAPIFRKPMRAIRTRRGASFRLMSHFRHRSILSHQQPSHRHIPSIFPDRISRRINGAVFLRRGVIFPSSCLVLFLYVLLCAFDFFIYIFPCFFGSCSREKQKVATASCLLDRRTHTLMMSRREEGA
jgi:hypothetical protein